ncbi:protein HEG-like isoform X2 [Arapaima gigas]
MTASPFDAASLTALRTETTDGRDDEVGVTDSSPVLSEEPERQSGTDSEHKSEGRTDGNVNDEDLEFSSMTADTYIFSSSSKAQKTTSASVIAHNVTNQELNTSKIATRTPSEVHQTSSGSSFQTSFQASTQTSPQGSTQTSPQGSTQTSPQGSTHISPQTSAQVSSQTVKPISYIYSKSSQDSQSISQSSTHTLSLLPSETSSKISPQTSLQTSQTSFQTPSQTLAQTSSQTTAEAFAQSTLLTSSRSLISEESENTIGQNRVNMTTSSDFFQLDNTTEHYNPQDCISPNNLSKMQNTDATQLSLDTASQIIPNSTLPLAASDDSMLSTEVVQYSTIHGGEVSPFENKVTLSSVPHEVSTEGSSSNTSLLVNENTVTSTGIMGFTTESPTEFYIHGSTEDSDKENKSPLASTVESSVIITTMNDSLTEVLHSQPPFATDTEKPGNTTVIPSETRWTGTQRSESSVDTTFKSTVGSTTFIPPNVRSTTGWPQVQLTTQTTTLKTPIPLTMSSTSQKALPSSPTATFTPNSSGTGPVTYHIETSAATLASTTEYKQTHTTAYSHTAPVRTTTAQTTKGFKEKLTMDVRTPTTFKTTKSSETPAKTFLGTFSSVNFSSVHLHEIHREILQLIFFHISFSKVKEAHISVVNMFFMRAEVTRADVLGSIQKYLRNCSQAVSHCRLVKHLKLSYNDESLCAAQEPLCDPKRTECTDISGVIFCQCHSGYFKQNPDDRSCLGCGDGFKLENGTCVPCVFGFGGFNCEHAYKLIAVVVSPAVGGLLLILLIALIVTCYRKDKNDINKMIFKSADFQLSSYTEFSKSSCVSMEWGRETLELQENGSTKNLLQMTDIYYPAALRNPEHERSGLCPFSSLPGSRHSCIYPAQWNPSFVSDDTRRRDYF